MDGIYLWKIVIIVVEGFAATAYQQIKQESLFKLAQFYTNPSLQVCHSQLRMKIWLSHEWKRMKNERKRAFS